MLPEQFAVKGLAARVRSMQLDHGPRRIILLLDRSGSMKQSRSHGGWQWAVHLAKEFLAQLHPGDQVSLHIFSTRSAQITGFTADFASVQREVEALTPPESSESKKQTGYQTLLYESLPKLLQAFDGEPQFGDSILIISDGGFQEGTNEIHRSLAESGVRVFLLLCSLPEVSISAYDHPGALTVLQYRIRGGDIPSALRSQFQYGVSLVRETGGDVFDPWKDVHVLAGGYEDFSIDDLFPRVSRVAYSVIKRVYRFELLLDAPLDQSKHFEIQFLNGQGKPEKDVYLLYPQYLGRVKSGAH